MLKYEETYQEMYPYRFFVNAGSEHKLMESFQKALNALELPEREKHDPQLKISTFHKWLEETNNWLLLFDNVEFDNVESKVGSIIRDLLPSTSCGHVLLTSQREGAMGHITGSQLCLELKEPEEDDAINMFFESSEIERGSELRKRAKEIVERVGFLPHAIDQAAAYIKAMGLSLDQYLDRYRKAPDQVRL